LYPHKSLYDNMAFGLRLRGTAEAEVNRRVMDAAKLLRIDHMLDRKPGALSGGQRQRVAIGRAIVRQPKVFLFDEPLSNLDAQLRTEMRTEIKKLHHRLGATIIYVTHDQVEAMTLADRIAVLSSGKVMQYATPHDIYNKPAAVFVAGFTGSPAMNLLPCVRDGAQVRIGNMRLELPPTLAAGQVPAALTFGIRPENVSLTANSPHPIRVEARVALCEPLGAETLVTFALVDTTGDGNEAATPELVARCSANFHQPVGTAMPLFLDPAQMHWFDTQSGQALV
jgi:multiple sugar transport system ATP-binding protein